MEYRRDRIPKSTADGVAEQTMPFSPAPSAFSMIVAA
jgi:hypothetical protein